MARLEETTGKRFGDPSDPLLVSVRSGAAVSMPGMMDTILNLGLNDEAVEGLARATGNPRFAYDAYRRLIQMYGDVVAGVDAQRFEEALAAAREGAGAAHDGELGADAARGAGRALQADLPPGRGRGLPAGRARPARRCYPRGLRLLGHSRGRGRTGGRNGISDDLGTAVNVVQMVFGNKGEESGTGVAFTRDPATGEQGLYGEFLVERAGRGRRRRRPHAAAARRARRAASPTLFEELLDTMRRLEQHYRECRTSSSRSRTAGSSSCRRGRRSARERRW